MSNFYLPGADRPSVDLAALADTVLGELLGTEATKYSDRATVLSVQQKLKALNKSTLDPGAIDGLWGTKTAKAVRALRIESNQKLDGGIDDWVLAALGLRVPSALATSPLLDSHAKGAAEAVAQARTPAEVKAAAQQVQAAVANAPPEVKAAAERALDAASKAVTPSEVADAKELIKDTIERAQETSMSPWQRPIWQGAPIKLWHISLATLLLIVFTFAWMPKE